MDLHSTINGITNLDKEISNFEFTIIFDRRLAAHLRSMTQQLKLEQEEFFTLMKNMIPSTVIERHQENLDNWETRLRSRNYTAGQPIKMLLLSTSTSYYIERSPLGIRAVVHAEVRVSDQRRPLFRVYELADGIFRSDTAWHRLDDERTILLYSRREAAGVQLTKQDWAECTLQGNVHFCAQGVLKKLQQLCLFNLHKRTGDYSTCEFQNATNTVLTRNDTTTVLIMEYNTSRTFTRYLNGARPKIQILQIGPNAVSCTAACSIIHGDEIYYIDNQNIHNEFIVDNPHDILWKHEPLLKTRPNKEHYTVAEALREMANLGAKKAKMWGVAHAALQGLHARDRDRELEFQKLKRDMRAVKDAADRQSHHALLLMVGVIVAACVSAAGIFVAFKYKSNFAVIRDCLHARQARTPKHYSVSSKGQQHKAVDNCYESVYKPPPSAPPTSVSANPRDSSVRFYPALPEPSAPYSASEDVDIDTTDNHQARKMDCNRGHQVRYNPVWFNNYTPPAIRAEVQQQPSPSGQGKPTVSRRSFQPTSQPDVNVMAGGSTKAVDDATRSIAELTVAANQQLHGEMKDAVREAHFQNFNTNIMLNKLEKERKSFRKLIEEARNISRESIDISNKLPTTEDLVSETLGRLASNVPAALLSRLQNIVTQEVSKAFDDFSTTFDNKGHDVNDAAKKFVRHTVADAMNKEKSHIHDYLDNEVCRRLLVVKGELVEEMRAVASAVNKEHTEAIRAHQHWTSEALDKLEINVQEDLQDKLKEVKEELWHPSSRRHAHASQTTGDKDDIRHLGKEIQQLKNNLESTNVWLSDLKQQVEEIHKSIRSGDDGSDHAMETDSPARRTLSPEAREIKVKLEQNKPFNMEVVARKHPHTEVLLDIDITAANDKTPDLEKRKQTIISWQPNVQPPVWDLERVELDRALTTFMRDDPNCTVTLKCEFSGRFPSDETAAVVTDLAARGWCCRISDNGDANMTRGVLPTLASFVRSLATPLHKSLRPMPKSKLAKAVGQQVKQVDFSFRSIDGLWGKVPAAHLNPEAYSPVTLGQISANVWLTRLMTADYNAKIQAVKESMMNQQGNITELQSAVGALRFPQGHQPVQARRTGPGDGGDGFATYIGTRVECMGTEITKHRKETKVAIDAIRKEMVDAIATMSDERLLNDIGELKQANHFIRLESNKQSQRQRRQEQNIQMMAQALTHMAGAKAMEPTDGLAEIRDIARGSQQGNDDEDDPGANMQVQSPSCPDTRDGLDLIMSAYPIDDETTAPTAGSADTEATGGATDADAGPRQ